MKCVCDVAVEAALDFRRRLLGGEAELDLDVEPLKRFVSSACCIFVRGSGL